MQEVWQHFILKQDPQKLQEMHSYSCMNLFIFGESHSVFSWDFKVCSDVMAATTKCHKTVIFVACFGQL